MAHEITLVPGQRPIFCVCGKKAKYRESSYWNTGNTKSVSFYYYCPTCWKTPGPSGSSPKERMKLKEKTKKDPWLGPLHKIQETGKKSGNRT